jgi:hypothetical protein
LFLRREEIEGEDQSRDNPLVYYFTHNLGKKGLIDGQPVEVVPTWRNNTKGVEWLSKSIDIFLVLEKILEEEGRVRTWTSMGTSSNHKPILL